MRTLTDCPDSHAGEWNFSLFGVSVSVKIWFWVAVILLCGERPLRMAMIWVAACFGSILLHELGHVIAFRLFRHDADVVLYGWGGLAIPHRRLEGTLPRFVVALAGPFAGFTLAAIVLVVARAIGCRVIVGFDMLLPTLAVWPAAREIGAHVQTISHTYVALNDLLYINFYWGLMNLLPIYPLDGGHAARAAFEQYDPFQGRRKSLMLSIVVAACVALWGIAHQRFYLFVAFTILAVSSLQMREGEGARMPRRSPGTRR